MWKIEDVVVYGSAGICKVEDIRDEMFGGEIKKYLVLKPLFDDKNTFFVPSFNERLMTKIRPVLTKSEMNKLLKSLPDIAPEWIDNDKQRLEKYREILESGDREKIVGILKALYNRRAYLFEKGKKLRTSDEILMKTGEHIIENECAYIVGISRLEVQNYISENV